MTSSTISECSLGRFPFNIGIIVAELEARTSLIVAHLEEPCSSPRHPPVSTPESLGAEVGHSITMRFSRNVRRFSQPLSIISESQGGPPVVAMSFSFLTHISACTDKLRQNDPGFVELSLERVGEDFDLDDFCHGIRCNSTVRHVCFSGTFVRELAEGQWRTMLESIGHLSTLEELQIWCSTIPADVFAHTLRNARRLHKVYFFRVSLSGTQADFDDLAAAVRTHPMLRDFRIGGLHIAGDATMDSIVEALAAVPSLQVVSLQLSGVRDSTPFGGDSLARLVCSPFVEDLYLSRLGLGGEHFGVIALGILASNNLKGLDLFGNNVENDHVIMLIEALQRNHSLETLVLPCPADDLSVASCAAICSMLQANKTLQTLNLPRSTLDDGGLLYLAEGLKANHTLKKIEVGVKKDLGTKGVAALTAMLETNYELERLVLSSAEQSIKDKIDHYMRLNEVGRGTLLRNGKASREQWVEMLTICIDDLDCLFYFISRNPALCQFARAALTDVIVTEEFRLTRRHTINHFNQPVPPVPRREPRRASAF